MEVKLLFTILAFFVGLYGFVPYFKDILAGKTKPHAYTWLIWTITQGVATAGIFYGGGGYSSYSWMFGTLLVFLVFLLSLKYGTRNITLSDTVVLIVALIAIGIWVFLDEPVISILMVTAIDLLGYIPSYRKVYEEPGTEPARSYLFFIAGSLLSIAALFEYNILTLSYVVAITFANSFMVFLILTRKKALMSAVDKGVNTGDKRQKTDSIEMGESEK